MKASSRADCAACTIPRGISCVAMKRDPYKRREVDALDFVRLYLFPPT